MKASTYICTIYLVYLPHASQSRAPPPHPSIPGFTILATRGKQLIIQFLFLIQPSHHGDNPRVAIALLLSSKARQHESDHSKLLPSPAMACARASPARLSTKGVEVKPLLA